MNSPVPRHGLIAMLVIVIALAFVALYANVQRFRRDKIDIKTFTPAASPAPSTSPAR